MAKLIVERPRTGGGLRFPRERVAGGSRVPLEDSGRHEGMRRPWLRNRPKDLNENLAPLRRYLRSNVGRPWTKVYSEVCERINRDSAVQLHVWQHLMQDVCTDPYVIQGDVRRWPGFEWCRFYVDPRSGLLRENKTWGRRWRKQAEKKPLDRVEIDATHEYRLLDGLWYELELTPLQDGFSIYDMALKKTWPFDGTDAFVKFYGRRVYAARKRQLNTKEIRRMPEPE